MPDALASLTTQKASSALAGALAAPLLGGPIRRIARGNIGEALVGFAIVWAGASMFDGHAEAMTLGAGVSLIADGLFRMFLTVNAEA